MTLQRQILREYKEIFPHQTLKQISEETGIQITRVFRIFNGQEMKLKEYEAIYNKVQNHKQAKDKELISLVEEGLILLSSESLNDIKMSLMRKLSMKKLVAC
jgi:predicted transcriptional regulator